MLRGTTREKQSKIMPCYDATAGKILCTELQNAHKCSVVSTPAKPNNTSCLAQKENYMTHKKKEKIRMKYTLFFLTSDEMGQPFF